MVAGPDFEDNLYDSTTSFPDDVERLRLIESAVVKVQLHTAIVDTIQRANSTCVIDPQYSWPATCSTAATFWRIWLQEWGGSR
jgi:hypothetical protein